VNDVSSTPTMKKITILIEWDTVKADLSEDPRTMEEKCKMGARRHPDGN
jgi:hypothetical protein